MIRNDEKSCFIVTCMQCEAVYRIKDISNSPRVCTCGCERFSYHVHEVFDPPPGYEPRMIFKIEGE